MIVEPDRGPKRPTVKVPGAHGGDLNTTRSTSVKDCRLRAGEKVRVRAKSDARPCGGFVRESDTIAQVFTKPPTINRRHAERRFAKAMANRLA